MRKTKTEKHTRNRVFSALLLTLAISISAPVCAEVQYGFTDSFTAPTVGASTSGNISATVGGVASTLSYTRTNHYGGLQGITPVSGTGKFASLTGSAKRYGLLFDTFQVFQSLTSNLYFAVASTSTTCPGNTTYNWLLVRYRTYDLSTGNSSLNQPMDFSKNTQFVGGTTNFVSGTSTFTGVDYFDLNSLTLHNSSSGDWAAFGFGGFGGASCSSGFYKVQSTGAQLMDQYGYTYFGSASAMIVSGSGNPAVTVALTQQNLTSTVMGYYANDVLTGFITKFTAWKNQDQRAIYLVPNGGNFSGSTYEFGIYQASTNLTSGSPDVSVLTSSTQSPASQTKLGKITCTSLNSPTNGFCSGTLDMSDSGVSGTGNAVCMFGDGTTNHLMACSAQYPADSRIGVSFVAQASASALISNSLSNSGLAQVASAGSSTSLTATIKNLTGRAITSIGNPSDLGLSASLDLSAPFTKPSYSGGGSCGTTLNAFSSCTLSVPYNPSSVGANLQTFRSTYASGGNGTVSATATLIGTADLQSIAIVSPNYMGATGSLTAVATFGDGSIQDVTSAVSWSSDNGNISVTSTPGTAGNGAVVANALASATITASIGATSGTLTITPFTTGTIRTIAGKLGQGNRLHNTYGVDGPAQNLGLEYVNGTTIDSSGHLYIADTTQHRVLMVPASTGTYFGRSMTANYAYIIAGTGTAGFSGLAGPATSAQVYSPKSLAVDSSGNVYIHDQNRILMLAATSATLWGVAMTANYLYRICGSSAGTQGDSGTDGPATSALISSGFLALDSTGNVFFSETGTHYIRMIAKTSATNFGQSMTANYMYDVGGNGNDGRIGEGGTATTARMSGPRGIALDSSGNVYFADSGNNRVQMIARTATTNFGRSMNIGRVYTILGDNGGSAGSSGNGAAGSNALLNYPTAVAINSSNDLIVGDNLNYRIQMMPKTTGTKYGQSMTAAYVYTIAGTSGSLGRDPDDTAATSSRIGWVWEMAVDSSQNLYFADEYHSRVQVVAGTTGTLFGQSVTANRLYTLAGNRSGDQGAGGVGGPSTLASLNRPDGVVHDTFGNLYIADSANNRVQMIPSQSGTYFGQSMTANYAYTIAGSSAGTNGLSGTNGPATSALMYDIKSVAVDSSGNLYIAETGDNRVLFVPRTSGTYFGRSLTAANLYNIAGNAGGSAGGPLTGVAATSAYFNGPTSIALDSTENLFVTDTTNNRIVMVPKTSGTYFGQSMTANYMYTIAGDGTAAYGGDAGVATSAYINYPTGVSTDSAGNVYILDSANRRVRFVARASGTYFGQSMTAAYIYTIFGSGGVGATGNGGPATSASMSGPVGVALDSSGNLFVSDSGNSRIQMVPIATGTYFGQSMTANYAYTVGGTAQSSGFFGDDGAATSAVMWMPKGIYLDKSGNIIFSDTFNNLVRQILR